MPSITNRANALTRTAAAQIVSTAPITRTGSQNGSGVSNRQPVSHQGTTPATTPGASAKKIPLPAAAAQRRSSRLRGGTARC